MVQTHLDQKLKTMRKTTKEKLTNIFYLFNKKIFRDYYKILKRNPEKVTTKFLTRLILQNSKIEKQNNKFFSKSKANHLNDIDDDEELFVRALIIFISIFFLWLFLFILYIFLF